MISAREQIAALMVAAKVADLAPLVVDLDFIIRTFNPAMPAVALESLRVVLSQWMAARELATDADDAEAHGKVDRGVRLLQAAVRALEPVS